MDGLVAKGKLVRYQIKLGTVAKRLGLSFSDFSPILNYGNLTAEQSAVVRQMIAEARVNPPETLRNEPLRSQVAELLAAGHTQSEIARQVGVTRQRVQQIVKTDGQPCRRRGRPKKRELQQQMITEKKAEETAE